MADTLLSGKTFVVTGGTQGLGRGIALHLARQGAAGIVICGRNQENGRAAAQEISEAGGSCTYVRCQFSPDMGPSIFGQSGLGSFGGRVSGTDGGCFRWNLGTG